MDASVGVAPAGTGEFQSGAWCDNGSGWREHPEVAAELKPTVADDGIFWLTKGEFFLTFQHFTCLPAT